MSTRKGISRRADIPAALLSDLNAGRIESATLAEGLAIDFRILLRSALPKAANHAERLGPTVGISKRMAEAGKIVAEVGGPKGIARLSQHPSDTVRGWAAFAIAVDPRVTIEKRLEQIRPLADDRHFGVREWAWIAIRGHIAADIEQSVELLIPWTAEPSDALRRFASESTRPRGVWCAHINEVKEDPAIGLPLLEPLRSDPSEYVQNSVANWLNDAGKDHPKWVKQLCRRWLKDSPTTETARICKRAQRNLKG